MHSKIDDIFTLYFYPLIFVAIHLPAIQVGGAKGTTGLKHFEEKMQFFWRYAHMTDNQIALIGNRSGERVPNRNDGFANNATK